MKCDETVTSAKRNLSKEGFHADFDQRITRLRFTWVLKLTSQLRLVPDLPLLGGGRNNRRIQQGIENRGFNQIKKFLRGNKPDNRRICFSEKKFLGLGAL